jgi:predicted flap endonuclease-1-like 5' DNA nuclease
MAGVILKIAQQFAEYLPQSSKTEGRMSADHQEENASGFSWWWILPWLAAGLAALFYLLWIRRRDGAEIQPVHIDLSFIRGSVAPQEPEPVPAAPPVESVPPAKEPESKPEAPSKPDDLTTISGIGPKIAALLQEQGLKTFNQLAEATPENLRKILESANVRLADPATWPEQARLAAAGKIDELKEFIARQRANRGG